VEFLASILVAIIVVELYAWLPKIAEWLRELAVSRVRAEDRERCREEWKERLNGLPNTVIRVVDAFSLLGAARQINADVCEDKLAELNTRLANLSDIHHRNCRKVKEAEQLFWSNRESRDTRFRCAEKDLQESNLRLLDASAPHPSLQMSVKRMQELTDNFVKTLHVSFERTDHLIEEMIGRHVIKIKEGEVVLREILVAYASAKHLLRYRLKSLRFLASSVADLETKVSQLEMDIDHENECPENDEPLAEYNRISGARASVGNARRL